MFRSILVPLDGTPAAAEILAYIPLVVAPDARVTLVGVAAPLLDGSTTPLKEREIVEQVEHFRAYLWQELETRAKPLREQGLHVVTTVRTGDVTAEILACAREVDADLIALTTHAPVDLSHWMLRSVAQQVLNAATIPTLIIRAHGNTGHQDARIDGVVVPLDGWSLAEAALPVASELAAQLSVKRAIIRVVPDRVSLLAPTDGLSDLASAHRLSVALEQAVAAAERYIQSTVDQLRSSGGDVSGVVRVGDPSTTLSAFVAEQPNALVVMATRGASGGDWWTFGSVAEKLVTTTPNLLLIVRPLAGRTGWMRSHPAIAARYPD